MSTFLDSAKEIEESLIGMYLPIKSGFKYSFSINKDKPVVKGISKFENSNDRNVVNCQITLLKEVEVINKKEVEKLQKENVEKFNQIIGLTKQDMILQLSVPFFQQMMKVIRKNLNYKRIEMVRFGEKFNTTFTFECFNE